MKELEKKSTNYNSELKARSSKKVVILGGGITGLGAAWRLTEKGFSVDILEMEDRPGGLAASIRKNGYIFDLGIHGMFPSKKGNEEILNAVTKLPGIELGTVSKKTKIYFRNRYHDYPLGLKNIVLALNPFVAVVCLLDFVQTRIRRRLRFINEGLDFESWVSTHFGKMLYNRFFGPYAQKIWGVHPSNLSAYQLVRRVTTVSLWDVFVKAFNSLFKVITKKDNLYTQQPPTFLYPYKGSGAFAEGILDQVVKNGGLIHYNSKAVKVKVEDDVIKHVVFHRGGENEIMECDYLISTIPINNLVQIIDPIKDESVIEAANFIKYRAMIILNLMINRLKISDSQWIYFSDNKFLFNRINEFSNIHRSFCPEGKTSLCIEITCDEGDNVWNLSEKEIHDRCVNDLEELSLLHREEIDDYFVVRLNNAYPVWTLGTERYLKMIFNYLENIKNIYTIGRQGLFEYINMDEGIKEGFEAADKIIREEA